MEVEKIGFIGEPAVPSEILYDPTHIWLLSASIAAFGNYRLHVIIVLEEESWN